jgi:hypothetical protein
MGLAASTAFVERVDLFMQSREFRPHLSPSDLCHDCNKQMLFKAIHTTLALEEHIFRCRNCGSEHTRQFRPDDFFRSWSERKELAALFVNADRGSPEKVPF